MYWPCSVNTERDDVGQRLPARPRRPPRHWRRARAARRYRACAGRPENCDRRRNRAGRFRRANPGGRERLASLDAKIAVRVSGRPAPRRRTKWRSALIREAVAACDKQPAGRSRKGPSKAFGRRRRLWRRCRRNSMAGQYRDISPSIKLVPLACACRATGPCARVYKAATSTNWELPMRMWGAEGQRWRL